MALGKYSRIDNRRSSSSYCSTVTIVVFVALCLVGIWMLTSSSVVPVQNIDVPVENKNLAKEQVIETSDGKTQPFEDNPGDLPDDARKEGDSQASNQEEKPEAEEKPEEKPEDKPEENPEDKPEENPEDKPEENPEDKPEDKPEEKPDEQNEDKNGGNEETKRDDERETENGDSKEENGEPDSETRPEAGDNESGGQGDSEENSNEKQSNSNDTEEKNDDEKKTDDPSDTKDGENVNGQEGENVKLNDKSSDETNENNQSKNPASGEVFPSGAQSELLNETSTQNGSWSTQAAESKNEKETQRSSAKQSGYEWKICNVTAGSDYIPCLDNLQAIRSLHSTKHYEHRERHCPEEPPTCLVSLPEGYKRPITWPTSREKIWYYNVPHTKLAEVKGHQNWVKVSGEYLTFPGGGTQFKHGALHYIDFIQEAVNDIAWGKRSRVILDVGCGVASFGGFLFERDVLTMSLAPKDEHEAQVQFALERGIPAISAVMGTKRLPYPGRVFDVVHCARCRVPWHAEGGKLLLELNRLLRPGGFFVWSATPVYQKKAEDVEIWNAMKELTKAMCWELVSINKDTVDEVSAAIYRKPTNNDCYEQRSEKEPPICPNSDDPNAAWNVPLQACMHKISTNASERGSKWPEQWPSRLEKTPYWLLNSQVGVYGRPAPEDFAADHKHWNSVVTKSYLAGMGIDWSTVRNVMDMRAIYGGFAAALKDLKVWVMNVVSIDSADTLPIIYERGLFGIYHDWCESFSTYPRTYDLLHADHLFSKIKTRCNLAALVAETDRILRPGGKLIVRDLAETVNELENMFKSMKWEVRFTYFKDNEALLCVQKSMWRPNESETLQYAIS